MICHWANPWVTPRLEKMECTADALQKAQTSASTRKLTQALYSGQPCHRSVMDMPRPVVAGYVLEEFV